MRRAKPRTHVLRAKESLHAARKAHLARLHDRMERARKAALRGQSTHHTRWTGPALMDVWKSRGTLAAAGKAIGVTAATVSNWLNGVKEPSLGHGLRLSDFLGVKPWVLCQWLESRRVARRELLDSLGSDRPRPKPRGRYGRGFAGKGKGKS